MIQNGFIPFNKKNTMSKRYSIFSTRQDYEKAYSEIQSLEPKLNRKLDWKKIKNTNFDQLSEMIRIFKKEIL